MEIEDLVVLARGSDEEELAPGKEPGIELLAAEPATSGTGAPRRFPVPWKAPLLGGT